MKYIMLDSFKAQTRQGETELKAGQIITLPHEIAIRLLNAGLITPVGRVAYRIYSNIFEAFLWVVQDDAGADKLRAEGISEPIYTGHEIAELRGLDREGLGAVHNVKTVFDESQIKSVRLTEINLLEG